jgi:hypothetical protein
MPLDSQKLTGLSSSQRAIVIARVANLLIAAAGVAAEESGHDGQ